MASVPTNVKTIECLVAEQKDRIAELERRESLLIETLECFFRLDTKKTVLDKEEDVSDILKDISDFYPDES
jgi:hypothetical protein